MSKTNPSSTIQYLYALLNLPTSKKWVALTLGLSALIYPGHNQLQTIVLNPGPIYAYESKHYELSAYPVADGTPVPPVSATSYLIQDQVGKTILASRRPDVTLPPASITKLMTALVALDYWSNPNSVLTVVNEDRAIGQTIDLTTGEQLTLDSLLHGLLIHSGNDAALTIADNYPGGYSAFVQAMNNKAEKIHLTNTTYKNPSGIDQYGHITTARDIATLASVALSDPRISSIVTKDKLQITDITGTRVHDLESTDELLLTLPGLLGGKTGWTSGAGECFVSKVSRDGRGIITVVLGSTDRFADTTTLVEWAYAHHRWTEIDVSMPF